jgi:hypothetical protein
MLWVLAGTNLRFSIFWYVMQCVLAFQYSGTNVMHFLFNLLRIKGFYMLRALLAHPQEALHQRHLAYCARVISVGCTNPDLCAKGECRL